MERITTLQYCICERSFPSIGSNNVDLTPPSRLATFMRCPGCNAGDVFKKKLSKDMIKHSQGATCFKIISLYTTLAMYGCVSRITKDTDSVLMKTTFHT